MAQINTNPQNSDYTSFNSPTQSAGPTLKQRVDTGIKQQQMSLYSEKIKFDPNEVKRFNNFISNFPEISPDAAVAAIVTNNYNYDNAIKEIDTLVKQTSFQTTQQAEAANENKFFLEKEAYQQYKSENPIMFNPLRNADLLGESLGMRRADDPLKALSRIGVTAISAPFEMTGNIMNLFQSMMGGLGKAIGWDNSETTMLFKDRNGKEINASGVDMLAYIVGNTQASVFFEEWGKKGFALDQMPDTGTGWLIIDPESEAGLAFEKSLTNTGAMLRTNSGQDVASNFASLLYDQFVNEDSAKYQEGYQIAAMGGQFANYLFGDPKGTVDLAKMIGKGATKVGGGIKNAASFGGGVVTNPAQAMARVSMKVKSISAAGQEIGTGKVFEQAQKLNVAATEKAKTEQALRQAAKVLRKDKTNPDKQIVVASAYVKMQQANLAYAKTLKGETLSTEELSVLQEVEPIARQEELTLIDDARSAKRAEEAEKLIARQQKLETAINDNAKELLEVSKESSTYNTLKQRRQSLTQRKVEVEAAIKANTERAQFGASSPTVSAELFSPIAATRRAIASNATPAGEINITDFISNSTPEQIISEAAITPNKFAPTFWEEFTKNSNALQDNVVPTNKVPEISNSEIAQVSGNTGLDNPKVGKAIIAMIDRNLIKPNNATLTNLIENYALDNIAELTNKEISTVLNNLDFNSMSLDEIGKLRASVSRAVVESRANAIANNKFDVHEQLGDLHQAVHENIPLSENFIKEFIAEANVLTKAGKIDELEDFKIAAVGLFANKALTLKQYNRLKKLVSNSAGRQVFLQGTGDQPAFDEVFTNFDNLVTKSVDGSDITNIDTVFNEVRYILNNPNLNAETVERFNVGLARLDERTLTGKLQTLRPKYLSVISEIAGETKYTDLVVRRVTGYESTGNLIIKSDTNIIEKLINNRNTKLQDKLNLIYAYENTSFVTLAKNKINLNEINFSNETPNSVGAFVTEYLLPREVKNVRHIAGFPEESLAAESFEVFNASELFNFVNNVDNIGLPDLAKALTFKITQSNKLANDFALQLALNNKTSLLSQSDLINAYNNATDSYARYFLVLDDRIPESEVFDTLIQLATSDNIANRTAAFYHPRATADVRVAATFDGIERSDLLDTLTSVDFDNIAALSLRLKEADETLAPVNYADNATAKVEEVVVENFEIIKSDLRDLSTYDFSEKYFKSLDKIDLNLSKDEILEFVQDVKISKTILTNDAYLRDYDFETRMIVGKILGNNLSVYLEALEELSIMKVLMNESVTFPEETISIYILNFWNILSDANKKLYLDRLSGNLNKLTGKNALASSRNVNIVEFIKYVQSENISDLKVSTLMNKDTNIGVWYSKNNRQIESFTTAIFDRRNVIDPKEYLNNVYGPDEELVYNFLLQQMVTRAAITNLPLGSNIKLDIADDIKSLMFLSGKAISKEQEVFLFDDLAKINSSDEIFKEGLSMLTGFNSFLSENFKSFKPNLYKQIYNKVEESLLKNNYDVLQTNKDLFGSRKTADRSSSLTRFIENYAENNFNNLTYKQVENAFKFNYQSNTIISNKLIGDLTGRGRSLAAQNLVETLDAEGIDPSGGENMAESSVAYTLGLEEELANRGIESLSEFISAGFLDDLSSTMIVRDYFGHDFNVTSTSGFKTLFTDYNTNKDNILELLFTFPESIHTGLIANVPLEHRADFARSFNEFLENIDETYGNAFNFTNNYDDLVYPPEGLMAADINILRRKADIIKAQAGVFDESVDNTLQEAFSNIAFDDRYEFEGYNIFTGEGNKPEDIVNFLKEIITINNRVTADKFPVIDSLIQYLTTADKGTLNPELSAQVFDAMFNKIGFEPYKLYFANKIDELDRNAAYKIYDELTEINDLFEDYSYAYNIQLSNPELEKLWTISELPNLKELVVAKLINGENRPNNMLLASFYAANNKFTQDDLFVLESLIKQNKDNAFSHNKTILASALATNPTIVAEAGPATKMRRYEINGKDYYDYIPDNVAKYFDYDTSISFEEFNLDEIIENGRGYIAGNLVNYIDETWKADFERFAKRSKLPDNVIVDTDNIRTATVVSDFNANILANRISTALYANIVPNPQSMDPKLNKPYESLAKIKDSVPNLKEIDFDTITRKELQEIFPGIINIEEAGMEVGKAYGKLLQEIQANPNKPVTVYRAIDSELDDVIYPGDFLTLEKEYIDVLFRDLMPDAQILGEELVNKKIVKAEIMPSDLYIDSQRKFEVGYYPQRGLPENFNFEDEYYTAQNINIEARTNDIVELFVDNTITPYNGLQNKYTQQKLLLNYVNDFLENPDLQTADFNEVVIPFAKSLVNNSNDADIAKFLKEDIRPEIRNAIVEQALVENKLSANNIIELFEEYGIESFPIKSATRIEELPQPIFEAMVTSKTVASAPKAFGDWDSFFTGNIADGKLKVEFSNAQLDQIIQGVINRKIPASAVSNVLRSKHANYAKVAALLDAMQTNLKPITSASKAQLTGDKKVAKAMVDAINDKANPFTFEQGLMESLNQYIIDAEVKAKIQPNYLSIDEEIDVFINELDALNSVSITENKINEILSKYINVETEGLPATFKATDGKKYGELLNVLSNPNLDIAYKFNVLNKLVENLNNGADKAFVAVSKDTVPVGQVIDNWTTDDFAEAFKAVDSISNDNARLEMSKFIAESLMVTTASLDRSLNAEETLSFLKLFYNNIDTFGAVEKIRFAKTGSPKAYSVFDKLDADEFNNNFDSFVDLIIDEISGSNTNANELLARLLYERRNLLTEDQIMVLGMLHRDSVASSIKNGSITNLLEKTIVYKIAPKLPYYLRKDIKNNIDGVIADISKDGTDLYGSDYMNRSLSQPIFDEVIGAYYNKFTPFTKSQLKAPSKPDPAIDLELNDINKEMSNMRGNLDESSYEGGLNSKQQGLNAKQELLNENNFFGLQDIEELDALATAQREAKTIRNADTPIEEQLADAAIGIEKTITGQNSNLDPNFLMDKFKSARWKPMIDIVASMKNKMDVDDILGRYVQSDEFITALADAETYDDVIAIFEAMVSQGVMRQDNLRRLSPATAGIINALNEPKGFKVPTSTKGQHEARTRALASGITGPARKYLNKFRFVEVSESPYLKVTDANDKLAVARLFRDAMEFGARYHMPGLKNNRGERIRDMIDDFAERMYRAETPEQRITIRNESGNAIAKFFAEEWGDKLPGKFKQELLNEFSKATNAARNSEIQARNYAAGLDATNTFGGQPLDQTRLYDATQLTDTWGMYDISTLRNLTSQTYSTMVALYGNSKFSPARIMKTARYMFDSFWRITHLARIAFAVRNALLDVTVRNYAGGLPNIITHPREVLASLVSETNNGKWATLWRDILGPNSFGIDLNGNPMKISVNDPNWVEQVTDRTGYRTGLLERDTRRDPGSFSTSTYGRSVYEAVPYDTLGFDKAWAGNLVEMLLSPVKLEVWGAMIGKPTSTLRNHIRRFGSVDPRLTTDPQYALAHMLINGDSQAAKDWVALRDSYSLKGINQKRLSPKDEASQEIAKQMNSVEGTLAMLFEETGSYAAQWRTLTGNLNENIVSILSNREGVFKFGLGGDAVLKKTIANLESKVATIRRGTEGFPQFSVTRRYSEGRSMSDYDNIFETTMGFVARISNTAEKAVGYDLGYREFYMEQVLQLAPLLRKEDLPELQKFAAMLAGSDVTMAGVTRTPTKKDIETVILIESKIAALKESDLIGSIEWKTFKNTVDEAAANQVEELYYDAKKVGQFYYAARLYLPFAAAWQDGLRKLAKAPTKRPGKSIPAIASAAFWYQYLNQEQSSWLSEVLGTPKPPEGQGYIWTDNFGQKKFYVPVMPYLLNLASTSAANVISGGRVPITMQYADGSTHLENLNMFTGGMTDASALMGQPDGSTEITLPNGGFVLQLAYNTLEPFIGENAVTKTIRNYLQPFGSSKNVLYEYTPSYLRKMLSVLLPGVFDEELEKHISDTAAFLYSTGKYSFPDGTSNTEQRNLLAQDAATLGKLALFGNAVFQSIGPAGIKNHYNIIGKDEMFYARTAIIAQKNKLMEEGLTSIESWTAMEAQYGLGVMLALATDNKPTGIANSKAYEALRKDPELGIKATSTFAYLFPGGMGSVELSKYYVSKDLGLTLPISEQIKISQSILYRIQKTRLEEFGIKNNMTNKQIDMMIGDYVAETYGEAGAPSFVDLGYSNTKQDVAELKAIIDSEAVKSSPVYQALLDAIATRDAGLAAIQGRSASTLTAESNRDISDALNIAYDSIIVDYPDSAILINRVFRKELGR